MSPMTKQNFHNIQCIFEKKTGVDLNPRHPGRRFPGKKLILIAAVLACGMLLASCTYQLFSMLHDDALYLGGSYKNGVVSVQVVNGSEKNLRFQEQVKLMSWKNGEIPPGEGKVRFENTLFPPHSSGTMTIDLSEAYPMAEMERTGTPNDLNLVLTNNGFQLGHDWICSFRLKEGEPEETQPVETERAEIEVIPQNTEGIDESLRFYFEDHYLDEAPAWNTVNGEYMMAVQELLSRQKGIQVHSMDPFLVVDDPAEGVIFDESLPEAMQYQLVWQDHGSLDAFNRMVSSVFPGNGMDTAMMVSVPLPQNQEGTGGDVADFSLLYYFIFLTQDIAQKDAYAFLYGRVLTFPEMEENMVYQDDMYTVYDMTDLFYTDLDTYLDDFLSAYGGEVYVDEQVRQRVRNIYNYYRNPENLRFHYVVDPKLGLHATPFVPAPGK